MNLHKSCTEAILVHLAKEGNIFSPVACDRCVHWADNICFKQWGYDDDPCFCPAHKE